MEEMNESTEHNLELNVNINNVTNFKKKFPGDHCCVVGCRNTRLNAPSNTKFYGFSVISHKRDQREKWIRAVRRINPNGSPWQPSRRSKICSVHFIGNQKSDLPQSPNYVPTIFPPQYRKKYTTEKSLDRFKRNVRKVMKNEGSQVTISSPTTNSFAIRGIDTEADIETTSNLEIPLTAVMRDQETQVNFLSEDLNFKIFLCNMYEKNSLCEAQTQANFPLTCSEEVMVENNFVKNVTSADKCCGPDPMDLNNTSLLKCRSGFHGFENLVDDRGIVGLSGVTFATFAFLLQFVVNHSSNGSLVAENKLLLFLMKMKLNMTNAALGVLFNIHRTSASRIFKSILTQLVQACKNLVTWPSKETVQSTMPDAFKDLYSNCRIIIDCTEFKVEQPPEVAQRVHFYSHYKKGYTIKILVGCTPAGYICFVSDAFGGRTTDAQITNSSGFLNFLESGDLILADKGFPEIKTVLNDSGKGVVLVMPPFLHEGHYTAEEVSETRQIARVRIHIERIMQRIKTYQILSKFSIKTLPLADAIIFMCCALVNLQPHIIKETFDDDDF